MAATFTQMPLASPIILRHSDNQINQYHPLFAATSWRASKLCLCCSRRSSQRVVALVGKGDTDLRVAQENDLQDQDQEDEEEEEEEATPEDLENIAQVKRVLELLRKNRDMLFSEVKLTIMIEDPREVERRRLLGIEDSDAPTRDDLAEALEQVNEGKVPKNRVALRMLAEEMVQWPNLEVEATKQKPSKSLYAKVTDTGIDPEMAAKRLNIDWDSAAEIEDAGGGDDPEVPSAVWFAFQGQEEVHNGVDDSRFYIIEEAKSTVKKESPEKEKQILVDPISIREPSFSLMLPPVITSARDTTVPLPPVLPPAKPKFLSYNLSNSAVSSPRLSSFLSKKRWKNESQASPREVHNIVRQQSAVVQSHTSSLQEESFRKSKSCGEGRANAYSDEVDFCLSKPDAGEYNKMSNASFSRADTNKYIHYGSSKNMDSHDDPEFKCSALCLFLPGFGKAKAVRPRKEEMVVMENVISRTVSLEKFECGSWASSAIANEHEEDGDSMNLYFDLPLELIRNSANDAHSPINAAFVFDKDVKGVLKNGSSRATTSAHKSQEPSRHVRFSVSSPTSYPSSPASCITPRLRKAREDFNAFLEAQSA